MYGLVLEGGGAKGAYHIGVSKALVEIGIEIGGVAGTSVGALNGAMIVQGELDKAYEVWQNINPSQIMKLTENEEKELDDLEAIGEKLSLKIERLRKIISEKGLDIEPLMKTLNELINEPKVRKSFMDFGMVTFDLTNRKPVEIFKEDIPEGKLIDYLIASANLPLFKMKTLDGSIYIDGGFYNVLPINLIQDKGYKDIVVVRTFGLGRIKKIDTTGFNIITIAPGESLGPVLDFSAERAQKNLAMGYFDAVKVFNNIKGKRYYIKPVNNDDYYVKYLLELETTKIAKLCHLFGLEDTYGKRALFEYVIPKIADILGVPSNASYEDILITLVEELARIYGIERFKVYTIDELISEIRKEYQPVKDDFINEMPAFIRGMNIVSKIARDKIISIIAAELGCV
ncbi:MAG TPA: patatin-like phospholipase family protein [Clostridiaceae bacterium]|jgi:NTE family protein|nr:patatin-like phospholipase family protein [Clostridiaceae bacterium]